jgi:CubicO group peptidase (beta-lactamase class C family)
MRRRPTLLLLAVSLFAPLVAAPPAAAQRSPFAALDGRLESLRARFEVPGFALAIVRNDSVVHARGFGVRELGRSEPVDANTLFAIGSASKAFAAATIGLLVDEGAARWDDRVVDHLPGFRMFDPYVTRELTLRDLLTHRSGLARGDFAWYGGAYDRAEVVRRVRHLEPSWSFRSYFGYQNIMYIAAGLVVAERTGASWEDVVKARVLRPLGMTASNTSVRELEGQSNVATPHARVGGMQAPVRPIRYRNIDNAGPAGSINSSVAEMAQWVRLNINDGVVAGRRIVSDSVVREMRTPQVVIRKEGAWAMMAPDAQFLNYGLGWFLNDYRGHRIVHHGGAIDGMSALVALIPEQRVGLVLLANLGGAAAFNTAAANTVFDHLLFGGRGEDWGARLEAMLAPMLAAAAEQERRVEESRATGTRPSLSLEHYAGTYADSLYGPVRVVHEGDRLAMYYQSNFAGDLEHWHYDTFRVTWRDASLGTTLVTFALDAQGRPARVTVPQLAVFGRVPDSQAGVAR